jgi:Flp pilus assembly protein CpaB
MQRGRLLIILAFLIILGAIVAVVLLQGGGSPVTQPTDPSGTRPPQVVQQLPTPTPLEFTEIVIALQELPRGFRIPANAVDLRPWPLVSAPVSSLTSLEDVIGKIARTRIFREQPILSTMITDDFTSLAEVGSDAAAVLPSGLVAVAIPIDRQTSVAYAVQDGDRVDILLSMLFVDVDDAFQSIAPNTITLFNITDTGIQFSSAFPGRPEVITLGPAIIGPSERQRPRLVTQRTIQDALVVHVGNFPLDGRFLGVPPTPTPPPAEDDTTATGQRGTPVPTATPARPDIITLGVTPQEAVVLVWAVEAKLPITLALRAATDTSRTTTQNVNLDYILNTYNIAPPAKRTFTIEPAIRSIRQLIAGDEISLAEAQAAP